MNFVNTYWNERKACKLLMVVLSAGAAGGPVTLADSLAILTELVTFMACGSLCS